MQHCKEDQAVPELQRLRELVHHKLRCRVWLGTGHIENEDASSRLVHNAVAEQEAPVRDAGAVVVHNALQLRGSNADALLQALHQHYEVHVEPSVHSDMRCTALLRRPGKERALAVRSRACLAHRRLVSELVLGPLPLVGSPMLCEHPFGIALHGKTSYAAVA